MTEQIHTAIEELVCDYFLHYLLADQMFFQGVLLTESMLKFLTCGERGDIQLRKILLVPEKQQPALHAYHSLMCSREEGQRSERFRQLSKELREQINTQNVADKVLPVC